MEKTLLIWLAVGLIAGNMIITWRHRLLGAFRSKAECTHCGSSAMKEINRETLDSHAVELGNGGHSFGSDIRLQLVQEVSYHCNNCHKRSKTNATKKQ